MVITQQSAICRSKFSHIFFKKNGGKLRNTTLLAEKRDVPKSSRKQEPPIFPLKVSTTLVARSAIAVFALGFIDAGYSGDWSRIGVITKESEDLLKLAAFIVVPLCLFFIFSLSSSRPED